MQFLWLILILVSLIFFGLSFTLRGKRMKQSAKELLGVGKKKIAPLFNEFKRKTFHLVGLLIPGLYYFFLRFDIFTHTQVLYILGSVMTFALTTDFLRFNSETFRKLFEKYAGGIMRAKETKEINGSTWFVVGGFLSVLLFEPSIAITSLLFLNLGDLSAALVGRAYGRTKLINGKSLEGCIANFVVCFVTAIFAFWGVPLAEYIAVTGALAATITELGPGIPTWINDNVTIPLISGFAMTLAMKRIGISEIPLGITGL